VVAVRARILAKPTGSTGAGVNPPGLRATPSPSLPTGCMARSSPTLHGPRRPSLAATALAIAAAACAPASSNQADEMGSPSALSAAEAAEGWRLLFDGRDLSAWRGFRRETPPASWSAAGGVLSFAPGDDRGDLMTREQFGDFELRLEWRISPAGNSGIIYRVTEDSSQPWHTGPEMQVLDDDGHPDSARGIDRNRTAGALYDVVGTPPGVVRPVGEWNEVRIVARGSQLEHWMNGVKVVDIVVGSEEWNRLIAASKFHDMPEFGVQPRGHIVLQDHADPVWYRNIRIRSLD
jgi:hypothetical protein